MTYFVIRDIVVITVLLFLLFSTYSFQNWIRNRGVNQLYRSMLTIEGCASALQQEVLEISREWDKVDDFMQQIEDLYFKEKAPPPDKVLDISLQGDIRKYIRPMSGHTVSDKTPYQTYNSSESDGQTIRLSAFPGKFGEEPDWLDEEGLRWATPKQRCILEQRAGIRADDGRVVILTPTQEDNEVVWLDKNGLRWLSPDQTKAYILGEKDAPRLDLIRIINEKAVPKEMAIRYSGELRTVELPQGTYPVLLNNIGKKYVLVELAD